MRLDQPDFKNRHASDKEAGVFGGFELLTSPVAIIILALITFASVYTVLLWRDGAFDGFWDSLSAKSAPAPDRKWMLGGHRHTRTNRSAAPPVRHPQAAAKTLPPKEASAEGPNVEQNIPDEQMAQPEE